MKCIQFIFLTGMLAIFSGCGNMKRGAGQDNGGGTGEPKTFGTAAEAAAAAKNDMLSAIAQKVDLGVDSVKLRAATAGEPIAHYDVNWDELLKGDTVTDLQRIAVPTYTSIVPFVADTVVIAVAGLNTDSQKFKINMLGDKKFTAELNAISKRTAIAKGGMTILEVPNLAATVYKVTLQGRSLYYTSYNNLSLREGVNGAAIVRLLWTDAQIFQKRFGDTLKKSKLVH